MAQIHLHTDPVRCQPHHSHLVANHAKLTLIAPSLAIVFLTTSIAPVYTPFSAVCNRTLTRSNGWPTTTAHMPPAPPATRSRKLCSDFFVATTTSCLSSSVEGSFSIGEEEDMLGYASRAVRNTQAGRLSYGNGLEL